MPGRKADAAEQRCAATAAIAAVQANAQSFDALKYNSRGNQVLAMVRTGEEGGVEW